MKILKLKSTITDSITKADARKKKEFSFINSFMKSIP